MSSKLLCHYLQKRPEKKRRVLHSTRYEESLTDIRHQLDALSTTLQSLSEKDRLSSGRRSSNDGSNSTPSSINIVADPPFSNDDCTLTDRRDYEGDSSFYSQSRRMADTLSQAVLSTPNDTTDAEAAVMQSLIHDSEDHRTHSGAKFQSNPSAFTQFPELAGLSLPPMDAVLRVLAFAKTCPQRYFDFPHTDKDEFADLCQKLYFPTRPYTIFAWINVNCGLFYLFRDIDVSQYDKLHLSKTQVSDIVSSCLKNVDRAIESLKLCVDPSYEAVAALVVAGAIKMERANGSMAWRLMSAAARMCIDLGYHRLPPGYGDKQKSQKRKLFWYVYSMEKSSAFNFGRASTIQDYDITTERPIHNEDFKDRWGPIFLGFIEFSCIQYNIYVQLFSAAAQQEPLSERVQRVHDFASKLLQMRERMEELLDSKDVIYRGTEICIFSALTLVYRILPPVDPSSTFAPSVDGTQQPTQSNQQNPLHFHPLCIDAGRAGLTSLITSSNEVAVDKDEDAAKTFVNWSLHHVPFMPFLAVLGNQVATGNKDDMRLLRDVTAIVETAAQTNSALNKLHRALSRLLRIAEVWRGTNSGCQEQRQSQTSQQAQPFASRNEQQRPLNVPNGAEHSLPSRGDVATASINTMDTMESNFPTWQDLDSEMTNQDWDMMFNEFDLGLGAESARDMIPWFEQHVSGFNM